MKKITTALFVLCLGIWLSSCVSMKKYNDANSSYKICNEENSLLKSKNLAYETKLTEQESLINKLKNQNSRLISDSTDNHANYTELYKKYASLSESYDTLLNKNLSMIKGNKAETQKILAELDKTKEALEKKEMDLKKMEADLNAKSATLNLLQSNLDEKQKKLDELQSILQRKDSVVKALKNKVSEALLGYENKGLTIYQKNGKIYVSMDESLLFASGKYEVTPKGTDALKKLAKVLESNQDINVMVEGHTDNVPYKGTDQLLDNWDLSVKRATTVVRILLNGSTINPERIIAAGRSQYVPIDKANTTEARAKNRRTEIILTPKLDELLKIIESN